HFRNEFDRMEPELPRLLASAPSGAALVHARRPEGSFLALARADSVRLGARRLSIVGGVEVDSTFLAALTRDRDLAISLVTPEGALPTDPLVDAALAKPASESIVRSVEIPLVAAGPAGTGTGAGASANASGTGGGVAAGAGTGSQTLASARLIV